ncbi:hypothetical protein NW754_003683 [Fusarium falciforme]|nr:hypothetical protein NW754_003683 [Fusarium falciforme]
MTAPGSDFLDSLSHLFSEAGSGGRDGKIEFAHLRATLIKFVSACSRMTAAKARASHNLKFIDGSEPQTLLALPPGKLRIDDKMRAELEATTTGDEFIEILRDLITKQSKAQQRAEAAQKNKKKTVRIKLRRSGERPDTDEKAQKTQTQTQTKQTETAKESRPVISQEALARLVPKLAQLSSKPAELVPKPAQPVPDSVQSVLKHAQPAPKPAPKPVPAHNLPGPMDVDANDDDDSSEGFALSESSDTSSSEDQSITYSDNGDTQMGDAVIPKVEEAANAEAANAWPAQRRPHISEVTAAAAQCNAGEWESFKPQLLDMLARIEADPTEEEIEAALKRLEQAVIKTKAERQFIPDRTWQKYHTKLVKDAKKGWFEKNWDDRIWRIGKICYLKEEEAVMVERNWDRLRAAAKMCAILTDMTAPPQEPNKSASIDKWLAEKLDSITFLKKALDCREHYSAICGF